MLWTFANFTYLEICHTTSTTKYSLLLATRFIVRQCKSHLKKTKNASSRLKTVQTLSCSKVFTYLFEKSTHQPNGLLKSKSTIFILDDDALTIKCECFAYWLTFNGTYRKVTPTVQCVQDFDDSLYSAIRITYHSSLCSSSIEEPRDPSLRVV